MTQPTNERWTAAVARAVERLATLSVKDKVAIALHDFAGTVADVVPFDYADGPNGVRGHRGATAFPSTLALAASFDRELAGDYGVALARETLAAGRNAIFAPGLDIIRVPYGGRAGQQLSEDPFLAGEIGGAVGEGVQSQGVLAVATHYVANNFEWLRTGEGSLPRRSPAVDVRVSDRTLHEIYLEPFRRALGRHGVAAFMGSYNRLNGEYTCQSRELLDLPRRLWGWAGVSVPDFIFAVRDPRAALMAGLDLPSLGDAAGRTEEDLEKLDEGKLDSIVLHVLTAAEQAALRRPPEATSEPPAGSAELARRIAADGMVLLTNGHGILPLTGRGRIVVIDAVDFRSVLVMGGAASVLLEDARIRTLPPELTNALDAEVAAHDGGLGERPLPPLAVEAADGPIEAVVRDDVTGEERAISLDRFELTATEEIGPDWSATVRTTFRARRRGSHLLTLEFAGRATLFANDRPLVTGFREASPMVFGPEYPLHAVLDVDVDEVVALRVEYSTSVAITVPGLPIGPHVRLGIADPDDRQRQAAELAADYDVAVVLAGRLSGEAMDVESLELPATQGALVAAVAAANPRCVLVTLGAGPVVLPPSVDAGAWLHCWFPGEQFAPALADVLSGRKEPGGRLPITFPVDERSTPIQDPAQYPGVNGTVTYSEELLVGYRWYDERGIGPAFPFGHGQGYTTFEIARLDVEHRADMYRVIVDVRNTGDRSGKAVPQIYVSYPPEAGEPPAQLKGFTVLWLEPGETRRATIDIARDDLCVFDERSGGRTVLSGDYEVRAGFSSRDIRATAALNV